MPTYRQNTAPAVCFQNDRTIWQFTELKGPEADNQPYRDRLQFHFEEDPRYPKTELHAALAQAGAVRID